MRRNLEIILVYAMGLIQGLILVIVPAASAVFCDPQHFGFSKSQYGALFVPQVVMSVLAALCGPQIASRFSSKIVFQTGVFFNCAAAALIALSQCLAGKPTAYFCMMLATACVGAGFGTVLPMINVYAQRFFPNNTAAALTCLHSLLGTGTALAPLLAVFFLKAGWWLLPVYSLAVASIILIFSFFLPLKTEDQPSHLREVGDPSPGGGMVLWFFIAIILLYGYCETMFGNWSIIYLNNEKGIASSSANYALSMFWVMVTLGRLLTALISKWVDPRRIYQALCVLIAISLWAVTTVKSPVMGIALFGLAGFSCSSFFPLSFSMAQGRFPSMAEKVSGFLMASYMAGYGLASYGIGKMVESSHLTLGSVYQVSSAIGIIMVILTFFIIS